MSPEERANDVIRGWLAAFDGAATGGAQIREFIAAAIRAAVLAEREEIRLLDMPTRPPGYTDEAWRIFECGWVAHVAAIRSRPA